MFSHSGFEGSLSAILRRQNRTHLSCGKETDGRGAAGENIDG
jgi:hypothetical protein